MANASFGGYCAATVSVHGDFLTSCIHIVQQYTEKGSLCQSLGQPGRLYRKNAFVRSSDRQEGLANGGKEAVPVLGKVRYSVNRSVNVRNIGNRTPAPDWAYAACRQENTSRPPRCCQCPYAPLTGVARPPGEGRTACLAARLRGGCPRRVPAARERAPQGSDSNPIRIKPWAARIRKSAECRISQSFRS